MAQQETVTYEVSVNGGETFTVMEEGLSYAQAGRALARIRDRRQVELASPDKDTYELHEVGGRTVWRWRTVVLEPAG